MKRVYLLLFLYLFIPAAGFAAELAQFKGKVLDAANQAPLAGATIYITDLKAITTTNAQGEFVLKNIPAKGRFLLEARFVGYKTYAAVIDLGSQKELTISLSPSIIESAEVVITGSPFSSNNKTNSLSVVSVGKNKLAQSGGTNLVDAIARIPGVSQVSTGGAISKPVIRGLGYNRVLTMVDGAREEAQQWGDEHGIEVDQFSAARIEILKGPASLLYGSDALGGVINVIDDLVPAPGVRNGEFTSAYSTNNGLSASSLMLQGNENGFVYRGRASYKNAYGFGYKGATVPNSGFNELNFNGMLGLNKSWGYSHLTFSRFHTNIGLVENGPDDHGNYLNEDGEVISADEAKERRLGLPFQNINHYRAALNSNFILGKGQLKTVFAFQQNIRKEFEESIQEPGLNLDLKSYTYDIKYYFPNLGKWEPAFGVQGMYQDNVNHGDEFLIPDYNSNNIGAFVYLKRNFDKGAINIGARYDYKKVDGKDLNFNGEEVFGGFSNEFSNVSGSLGFAYEIAKNLVLKGNAGSGFRAPNIAELGANGRHEGTFRYEIGNSKLKQETSVQFDLGLEYNAESVTFGLNAYANRIFNYIYPGNFNDETIPFDNNGSIETLPVYRYVQTNADLVGGEASVDFHLVKSLHFENSFSYTRGVNRATDTALPFIPAASINNEIRIEPNIKGLADSYIKVGLTNTFKQARFDSFETQTNGYTLLDAGLGTSIKTARGKLNLWVTGQNLLNKEYYNHLSRYKIANIYNPGRNVTFGISVPFL
ncbi:MULTISPECIES: TonB-dependent receptor [Pedobacter]|uniref:TonB-dependent receptor n=1 Tax=Pedobacter heparinus (strain ATCC 13125 / DSM 2366 / CIP 104194 / JCM 7457 / NBRC 12017 / NCIMB 9290 / NRRL B-14731 / HIM 762-3) TaxID=485917 RepID=C6XYD5_PEDHD|nr:MULTISPECIES: TonB-dependent receptor [Pedobacter]ACU02402.1 TonB-dependent receptor [Pedobacter heparinus DSM 2366]MBB5436977.1 iron complex outermembrane receptor protein [Pedobacter sp. AK017]